MARKLMRHDLSSFFAVLVNGIQVHPCQAALCRAPRMVELPAEDEAGIADGVDVAGEAVALVAAAAADIPSVLVSYAPVCMLPGMMILARVVLPRSPASVALFARYVPPEVFARPGKRLAHSTHNFHGCDRSSQDSVLVAVAAILTWAERGRPLNEHCRTPLWPNSDQERNAPGLICLDVRRVRCMKVREGLLRIAWKGLI